MVFREHLLALFQADYSLLGLASETRFLEAMGSFLRITFWRTRPSSNVLYRSLRIQRMLKFPKVHIGTINSTLVQFYIQVLFSKYTWFIFHNSIWNYYISFQPLGNLRNFTHVVHSTVVRCLYFDWCCCKYSY